MIDNEIKEIAKNFTVTKIKTILGEEIELPKLTLKIELRMLALFSKIVDLLELETIDSSAIFKNLYKSEEAIDLFIQMICELFGKDKEYVLNNLDIEGVISVLIPFYIGKIQAVTKIMEKSVDRISESFPIKEQTH